MFSSITGRNLIALLALVTLLGAGGPSIREQRQVERKQLKKSLSILHRCGRYQIRHGAIPEQRFEKCAEAYQNLGSDLFFAKESDGNDSLSSNQLSNRRPTSVPPVTPTPD